MLLVWMLICFGCKDSYDTKPEYIYFGGEIINPNSDYVILYNRAGVNDTIYLDENNRFLKRYDSIPSGLYRFWHQPESQMLLLEKGDSILARANTIEFDESLVFSGRGAKKNNFLVDMFLMNEKERQIYNDQKFKLKPDAFLKGLDSLEAIRKKKLNKTKEKLNPSELATKIMNTSFACHFYTMKEAYTMRHFGNHLTNAEAKFSSLPSNFFSHRDHIDINDSDLRLSYEYQRFLTRYIENSAYMSFAISNNYKQEEPNATLHKLDLIDGILTDNYNKNTQLGGITRQFIDFNEDSITSNKVLKKFLEISTNKEVSETMKKVVEYTTKLTPGNRIPNQKLIASDSTMVELLDLAQKKTLTAVYFWSILDIQYYKKAHARVAKLRDQYPYVQFISINIDEDKTKKWINVLDKYEYLRDFEYQFDDTGKSRNELVLYRFTRDKTILIGRDGKILNPNANIFEKLFESELDIYTQQQKASAKFLK